MSSAFIRIENCSMYWRGHGAGFLDESLSSEIRLDHIVDACQAAGKSRLLTPVSDEEYEANKDSDEYAIDGGRKGKRMPTVDLNLVTHQGSHSGAVRFPGQLKKFLKEVNAATLKHEAAKAEAREKGRLDARKPHRVNDRGEWEADEIYRTLDFVIKPGTTEGYLCKSLNQSSSEGALANNNFWCRFDLPD